MKLFTYINGKLAAYVLENMGYTEGVKAVRKDIALTNTKHKTAVLGLVENSNDYETPTPDLPDQPNPNASNSYRILGPYERA